MPDDFDDIIKALAHPLRRDILRWLKEPQRYFSEQHHSLENGVCAGQIDQRGLGRGVVVPQVVMHELKMPYDLTALPVERDHGTGGCCTAGHLGGREGRTLLQL